MKIRPKLLISFLSLCLIPLLVGAIYVTYSVNQSLTDKITDQLESVASIQKTKVQGILDKHLDRLALVGSRTQMRISLNNYINAGQAYEKTRVRKILNDAKGAITDFGFMKIVLQLIETASVQSRLKLVVMSLNRVPDDSGFQPSLE